MTALYARIAGRIKCLLPKWLGGGHARGIRVYEVRTALKTHAERVGSPPEANIYKHERVLTDRMRCSRPGCKSEWHRPIATRKKAGGA